MKTEEVPAAELQKVKNNFAAGEYRKLANNHAILQQLMRAEGAGDWKEINEGGPRIQAVTAADIQRVAGKYFTKENRAVATYTRKPGAAADDPDFAGLSDQQKPVARKVLAALKADTDLAALKVRAQQLEEQLGKAEAKTQPFLKLLRKKTQERITELEKKK